jgi:DNA-binding GntR family transcriptional regulator
MEYSGVYMLEGLNPGKQYQTKEEYIFETLRTAIMQCKILPEERLVIDQLATTFGVSSIPIRTVLQRLQVEGLVEIIPHTGAIVSGVSLETIDEIFSILGALESIAFVAAIRKIQDKDIKALELVLEAMDKATREDDVDAWSENNRNFHIRIAKIAQMNLLAEFTKRIFDQWDRIRRFYLVKDVFSQRINTAQSDHRQMFTLLIEHKGEELAAKAVEHNTSAKQAYQKWIHAHKAGTPQA